MPFYFDGNIPESITYNGQDVEIVNYNGVLIWEKAKSLGAMPAGTIVYLMEEEYTPYIVIAQDHHGEGLTTLLRQNVSGYGYFRYSVPSSAYLNRYSGSTLESDMKELFSALPAETQALIQTVDIPVLESASGGASTVTANFFPLSAIELVSGYSTDEGSHIEYFSTDDARKATDDNGEIQQYWTRSVVGGMYYAVRFVNTEGTLSNESTNIYRYWRPACCILSDCRATESDGKYYIA